MVNLGFLNHFIRLLLTKNSVSEGRIPLAKSVTPARIAANLHIVELSSTDLEEIDKISANGTQRYVYPPHGVNFGFPDKDYGKDAKVEHSKAVAASTA